MQNTVNVRSVAKSPNFKFQGGELVNIFYFKPQHFAIGKMVEQGVHL